MTCARTFVVTALIGLWPYISSAQEAPGAATQALPADQVLPEPPASPVEVPPLTDADRQAAFPEVERHASGDNAAHAFVLFDQFEWLTDHGAAGLNWDSKGWVGRDRDRLWFRSQGERQGHDVTHADAQLLYGRAVSRWWEVVAGARQDVGPGPARTWAAVGIQGLAPYWFDVEATAYVGAGGRTYARFETKYELRLTSRLVLQPQVEVEIYGKSDPERRISAGLSAADAGLRLRYEFVPEFAPYLGVAWSRTFFGTAEYARTAGDRTGDARLAIGLRFWL